jgi:hypothetical protein
LRKLIIAAAALGALTLFQNCSTAVYGSKTESLQQNSGGTGNGYDGKIYVVLSELPCPDSTYIDTAILVKDPQQAYLLRESCQSISPRPLAPASFTVISENQVAYNGTVYTEMKDSDLPRPILPEFGLKGFCTRVATKSADGFDGIVQLEIDMRGESGGVSLSMKPFDGTWLRQLPPFPAMKFTQNGNSSYSLAARTAGIFELFVANGIGTGQYRLEGVKDTLGFSGRPEIEQWNGTPFRCGDLPW